MCDLTEIARSAIAHSHIFYKMPPVGIEPPTSTPTSLTHTQLTKMVTGNATSLTDPKGNSGKCGKRKFLNSETPENSKIKIIKRRLGN